MARGWGVGNVLDQDFDDASAFIASLSAEVDAHGTIKGSHFHDLLPDHDTENGAAVMRDLASRDWEQEPAYLVRQAV